MQNNTHADAVLTEAGTFVGPISAENASLAVFVAAGAIGTLTLQVRPTPKRFTAEPGIAEAPSGAAAAAEAWADMPQVLAPGLNVIPNVPGMFDFQVGFKAGGGGGNAHVYLQADNYAGA